MSYKHALSGPVSVIPGLSELENDFKSVYVQLTSALARVRFDATVYHGVLGRIRQSMSIGGGAAISAAMSTGDAQQLMLGLLSRIGLAVAQAKKMETAYAAGDPRAIALADRLVDEGREAERIALGLAFAARTVSSGTSGLGLTSAEATVLIGLFLAPGTMGTSLPITLLLAAAQIITGLDATLTDAAGLFGTPSLSIFGGLPDALKGAGQQAVHDILGPIGTMLAVLLGVGIVGVVGYVGWNIYVARKAVKRVTGNPRRQRRKRRRQRRRIAVHGSAHGWYPASRVKSFNPERYDFRWNKDYSKFQPRPLRWHDDASYKRYQGDEGDY